MLVEFPAKTKRPKIPNSKCIIEWNKSKGQGLIWLDKNEDYV